MGTNQIILLNKPYEWTSFDAVKYVRKALSGEKTGHAGTLDPLATGLLILCTGAMTKKISEIQDAEKEYVGTMVLGATTPSFDLETDVTAKHDLTGISRQDIQEATMQFTGEIEQVPPPHSAIKVGGRRAYAMARNKESFELKPRLVTVMEFEITEITLPEVSFRIVCTKGTYIRSLVNDFGRALGCGAYLRALCRTRIGTYLLQDAVEPAQFSRKLADNEAVR